MNKKLGHVTILVKDFDEAIAFYTHQAGFVLLTDHAFGNGMRWVTVAPSKQSDTAIVFVKADTVEKEERVGNQAANHVFLVVETDDCYRDYENMKANGVTFYGEPKEVPWGIEVVFEDLYGNRLDLLQPSGHEREATQKNGFPMVRYQSYSERMNKRTKHSPDYSA